MGNPGPGKSRAGRHRLTGLGWAGPAPSAAAFSTEHKAQEKTEVKCLLDLKRPSQDLILQTTDKMKECG